MTTNQQIPTIESELLSLNEIVNRQDAQWLFNVPIYQRLYVWEEDQINTLLADIAQACEHGEEQFFLGNTMTVEKTTPSDEKAGQRVFDLIDGQQRFTTLWLLGSILPRSMDLHKFSAVEINQELTPRLHFSIRDTVNEYLKTLLQDPTHTQKDEADIKTLGKAQMLMQSFFSVQASDHGLEIAEMERARVERLASYIFNNVKLVVSRVPAGMDLNKLFEVINNRGVQLQHHEILKSQLLHAIAPEDRGRYAALWDSCADMTGFIERNLVSVTPLKAHQLANLYDKGEMADLGAVSTVLVKSESHAKGEARRTLENILYDPVSDQVDEANFSGNNKILHENSQSEENDIWARSIISFSLFLQHTLRIWLYENNLGDLERLKDKQLLDLFHHHFFIHGDSENEKAANAKGFFSLLWRLRVLWDDYVIKWVDQGEEEIHQLCSTSISASSDNRYINRSRESTVHQGLSLLQSMLYHSQEITTHYWLTPYLHYLYKNKLTAKKGANHINQAYHYLCHLDNQLLGEASKEPLVERTRWFMQDPWRKAKELAFEPELSVDGKHKGVQYPHYWFYKLDFVLWVQNRDRGRFWENFRFTAKNSVEHISPQQPRPEDRDVVSPSRINSFGNLVLVSRSINSEYSNLPFNEKKKRFDNKREYEKRPESLKMDLIYSNENWGDAQAEDHHKAMLTKLQAYYQYGFND